MPWTSAIWTSSRRKPAGRPVRTTYIVLLTRLILVSALAGLLATAQNDTNPDTNVVFRSDVSLVRVDAQVLDHDNRAVTGLRAEDFILRQDGRILPIRNFASENMPIDILLLLDVSGSMRVHVQRIADAAHEAMHVLANDDRIGIMVFDTYTRVRMPFRNSRDDVNRELERLLRQESFNGGTDITRALLDAADYVRRSARPDARRAIVILTDDQTQHERNEPAVERALERADAVLSLLLAPDAMAGGYGPHGGGYPGGGGGYPGGGGSTWPGGGGMGGPLGGIILGRRGGYGGRRPGGYGYPGRTHSAGTAEIARESGGDTMSVDDAYALETTLQRLRQRYALYFHLPEGVRAGEERSIEVDLADSARRRYRDAVVRYRRVYLAPGGSPDSAGPTMVTRAPATIPAERSHPVAIPDGEQSTSRRRVAVDEPQGPNVNMADTGDSSSTAAPAPAAAAPAPAPAADPAPPAKHVWRKATDPAPPASAPAPAPNPGQRPN